ncbi:hypothetical protein FACS1894198_1370 [Clostridia bacterium]|nr:hypothetical protein FACS1894198_1370 [Clostridia bacterium]
MKTKKKLTLLLGTAVVASAISLSSIVAAGRREGTPPPAARAVGGQPGFPTLRAMARLLLAEHRSSQEVLTGSAGGNRSETQRAETPGTAVQNGPRARSNGLQRASGEEPASDERADENPFPESLVLAIDEVIRKADDIVPLVRAELDARGLPTDGLWKAFVQVDHLRLSLIGRGSVLLAVGQDVTEQQRDSEAQRNEHQETSQRVAG